MAWSPDKTYYWWTPNDMNDEELEIVLNALRDQEYQKLQAKIWCWKMNYRNKKHYGLS
jgi:hypothetical protein|tara:strand:+ start:698 stop:871 length:174 start_codon:yes stop_codon:yes gene_type:complete